MKIHRSRRTWPWRLACLAALVAAAGANELESGREVERAEPSTAAQEQSIEWGRDSLGSRWRHPWYDGSRDRVRRIDVKSPWSTPNWQPAGGGGGPSFEWLPVLFWTAGLLLLAGVAYLLLRAWLLLEDKKMLGADGAGQSASGGAVDDAARVEALPFRITKGALDLLGEARRLYEQGNYAEAIVYLFSYQLVEMDKHQVVRLSKGKTNRQYLRELSRRRTLRQLVEQTMVAFEDVFFGNHELSRHRFESCWRRLDEFGRLVQQGTA